MCMPEWMDGWVDGWVRENAAKPRGFLWCFWRRGEEGPCEGQTRIPHDSMRTKSTEVATIMTIDSSYL